MRSRHGFTLFEVGLSLMLMSIGVVTVLMLMPQGIKSQQLARYQLLASAKAIDILSVNTNQWRKWDRQRLEGRRLGQNSINMVAHAPLAEQKASNWRHGCLPLPMDIARRLDSDNDEIKRVLDQGGVLFYSSPRANSSIAETELALDDRALPNEASRLVFAFVGHAQQYALVNHPLKAWPYYDWYPVPPRGRPGGGTNLTLAAPPFPRHEDAWVLNSWPGLTEFRALVAAWQAMPAPPAVPPIADVVAYLDLAKALAGTLGIGLDGDGVPVVPPGDALTPVEPQKVLAVAYIAQAMAWLTSSSFTPAPPTALADAYRLQAERAHERCLEWTRRYASTDPYDWGADRALNFQSAWDHPLLQYELFTASGAPATPLPAPNGVDKAWRVLSPRTVTNAGCANTYSRSLTGSGGRGNADEIAASWGDPATYNLTDRFAAAERCRQLVFWAVDWQSYEDFESAPSAPLDASKAAYDSDGTMAYNIGAHKFGNPEGYFVFTSAARGATQTNLGDQNGSAERLLGLYGADRNGNRRFDRGETPTSVRMRATTVARFNFYNPRVWCGLKN